MSKLKIQAALLGVLSVLPSGSVVWRVVGGCALVNSLLMVLDQYDGRDLPC